MRPKFTLGEEAVDAEALPIGRTQVKEFRQIFEK